MIVVFCLFPGQEEATLAAHRLIMEELCGSVTIIPHGRTHYLHQGEVASAEEHLCLCTTTEAAYAGVETVLRELHPYDTPEIFAVAASEVSEPYRRYLDRSVNITTG